MSTMKYPQFGELFAEMRVQIIRKCYPIPYVRLRQSCKFLDELCEKHRKCLGIYCYRDDPQLYLTDTLAVHPFKKNRTSTDEDLDGVHVIVNYGNRDGDHNFSVPMARENIPKIRASLSGFYFFEIFLVSGATDADDEKDKKFDEALAYFLEIASDLNVRYLTVSGLTAGQVQLAQNTWETVGLSVFYERRKINMEDFKEIVQKETVKKMTYVDYNLSSNTLPNALNEELILETIRGKRVFDLNVGTLSHEAAVRIWNMQTTWTEPVPSYFSLHFIREPDHFNHHQGYTFSNSVYATGLIVLQLNFKELPTAQRKYDIWISKATSTVWKCVVVKRIKRDTKTDVCFFRRAHFSRETLIGSLFFYLNISYPGNAYDYSGFYENVVKMETAEEIRDEYKKTADALLLFYSHMEAVPVVPVDEISL